jgi:hypothetical protein
LSRLENVSLEIVPAASGFVRVSYRRRKALHVILFQVHVARLSLSTQQELPKNAKRGWISWFINTTGSGYASVR